MSADPIMRPACPDRRLRVEDLPEDARQQLAQMREVDQRAYQAAVRMVRSSTAYSLSRTDRDRQQAREEWLDAAGELLAVIGELRARPDAPGC